MLVLSAGAGLIVGEILPFVTLFSEVFKLEGYATSSEAAVGAMQAAVPLMASTSAVIMAVGVDVMVVMGLLKYVWVGIAVIVASFFALSYLEHRRYTKKVATDSLAQ